MTALHVAGVVLRLAVDFVGLVTIGVALLGTLAPDPQLSRERPEDR